MEQFAVTKKGSLNTANWNPRTLSLSRAMGVVAVSDPTNTSDLFSRAMRLTSVKGWPDFHKSYISEKFNCAEARLTLRMKGELGTMTEVVTQTAGGEVRRYNFVKDLEVAEDAWMIRFASQEELDKAKALFVRMPRVKTPPMTKQNTEVAPSTVSVR